MKIMPVVAVLIQFWQDEIQFKRLAIKINEGGIIKYRQLQEVFVVDYRQGHKLVQLTERNSKK